MARTKYPFKVNGTDMPCPSRCEVNYQDISAPDSGRTLDGLMHKKKVGQKVKLELEWKGVSDEDASTILLAFDPEYVDVTYHDTKTNSILTKNFYTGDRKGSTYWWNDDGEFTYLSVAFNIVER
jgi:hypothetical protein